jgi:hypothetical protein
MNEAGRRYFFAGLCILLFIVAQTFQAFAYWFWIPASHGPQEDLLIYLLRVDQIRALLVMGTILLLIVPYAVIALRYIKIAPLVSALGLIFGAAFIGFEIAARSIDFFVVGQHWAHQLQTAASSADRETILHRFVMWNDMMLGWTFALRLAGFLASCTFAAATSNERAGWYRLAQTAFLLNALRLLGRLLSTFAGQRWLDPLNNTLYFPAVVVSYGMLALWFFYLARHAADELNTVS